MAECTGCLAWEYEGTKFGHRTPPEMFGWCRVHRERRERFQSCVQYSSKAAQNRQYLERVSKFANGEEGVKA